MSEFPVTRHGSDGAVQSLGDFIPGKPLESLHLDYRAQRRVNRAEATQQIFDLMQALLPGRRDSERLADVGPGHPLGNGRAWCTRSLLIRNAASPKNAFLSSSSHGEPGGSALTRVNSKYNSFTRIVGCQVWLVRSLHPDHGQPPQLRVEKLDEFARRFRAAAAQFRHEAVDGIGTLGGHRIHYHPKFTDLLHACKRHSETGQQRDEA